jgi:hypothetical protein
MYRIFLGVLCVAIAWLLFRPFNKRVYRFYRPGCPWCVDSQGEWYKFQIYCLFTTVQTVNINLDDPDGFHFSRLMGVKTVPTVIGEDSYGHTTVYDGKRTAAAYCRWISKV